MIYSVWNVSGYDRNEAVRLCRKNLNPLTAVLFASRGILDDDSIAVMLNRDISCVSDPFLLNDMDRAADRVRLAISRGEHVVVYGDYDVDGITSCCLLTDYLRGRGLTCDMYIPERLEEGYGVRNGAIDTIKRMGADLIITVDCGITAAECRRYAKKLGMDMVITDHHECGGEIPDPPVVDPCRPDCSSPARMLAGVGVAFKLACAVEGVENTGKLLEKYGDLVAVGTVADVMPVTGENRFYIQEGLKMLRKGIRPGFRELCLSAGLKPEKITVSGIGYTLAPRINAAGRLGGTDVAVSLLMARRQSEAADMAARLCELNRRRQGIEAEMLSEAMAMLKEHPPEDSPIVLAAEGWHQGVAGIVASRLSEKFGLPTVMICLREGIGRGSCRAPSGYNIYEALEKCRDLLITFGGHETAAGLTIDEINIARLREQLGREYGRMTAEKRQPELKIDFEVIKPQLLTVRNLEALEQLEPYGLGNPQPVLCMRDVLVENVTPLSEGKHTKMWINMKGTVFEAVCFGKSINELDAHAGGRADVAFTPQINEFRGRRTVQLCVADFAARN